jgi:hypothetical protein
MTDFSDAELIELTPEQLKQLTPEQLIRRNILIEEKRNVQRKVYNPIVSVLPTEGL